ncbi:MAG TPA: YihY/virulence factor BrkB family protein, partial [Alphaproteobacteria bacterium]
MSNTIEDSLIRRLVMALSYILFQPKAMLEGEDSNTMPFWLRFSMRLKVNLDQDQLGLLAAGVAFYFLMAAFPALAVLVSLYALVANPSTMAEQMNLLAQFLPHDALAILVDQVNKIAAAQEGTLSLSLLASSLITFYIASKGMRVLIKGFNIAFNREEHRNIFWRTFIAYGLTVGMIAYMFFSLILIAG